MKVTVSRERCIGCGLCTNLVWDVFRMDEEGIAEVYASVSETEKDMVQEAIDACPGNAIFWNT